MIDSRKKLPINNGKTIVDAGKLTEESRKVMYSCVSYLKLSCKLLKVKCKIRKSNGYDVQLK